MRLPHEYPFRLVERAANGSTRVVISANEFWTRGVRLRGAPLWLETMAQAAALTLAEPEESATGRDSEKVLAGVEGLRLEREPGPGSVVTVTTRLAARLGNAYRIDAEAEDEAGIFARASLLLATR